MTSILFFGSDIFSLKFFKKITFLFEKNRFINILNIDICCKPGSYLLIDYWSKNSHSWPFLSNLITWPPDQLSKYKIGLVASFGKFIDNKKIDIFQNGLYNIHPSLLPRWRGPCPIYHTLLNRDPYTGISLFKISKFDQKKFDVGTIVYREHINIEDIYDINNINLFEHIIEKLTDLAAIMVFDLIQKIQNNISFKTHNQNKPYIYNLLKDIPIDKGEIPFCMVSGPTYAPILNWQEFCKVKSFNINPLYMLHLYKCFGASSQGLRLNFMNTPIKIHKLFIPDDSYKIKLPEAPGELIFSYKYNAIFLALKPVNSYLQSNLLNAPNCIGFYKVTYNGKKMSALDFNNGYMHMKSKNCLTPMLS